MTENTDTVFTAEVLPSDDKSSWYPARNVVKPASPPFPPDEDIELWLKQNAPKTFQQLADIRYSLYHHCSRADFTVTNVMDDEFNLTGRHGTLRIVSDNARRYLLWRLRVLGEENGWVGAIPKTRKPRV